MCVCVCMCVQENNFGVKISLQNKWHGKISCSQYENVRGESITWKKHIRCNISILHLQELPTDLKKPDLFKGTISGKHCICINLMYWKSPCIVSSSAIKQTNYVTIRKHTNQNLHSCWRRCRHGRKLADCICQNIDTRLVPFLLTAADDAVIITDVVDVFLFFVVVIAAVVIIIFCFCCC